MRFVPIAPIELQQLFVRQYTFALAHMFRYPQYAKFFELFARQTYSILDNGAYEIKGTYTMATLYGIAQKYGFKEIVLPDILGESRASFKLTAAAIKQIVLLQEHNVVAPRYMIVPQGESLISWATCFELLCEEFRLVLGDAPFTVGIPKITSAFPGGRMYLLEKFVIPVQQKYNFEIHLLGLAESIVQLNTLNMFFGEYIRTFDSARPFTWAHLGEGISEIYEPIKKPHRHENYFHLEWDNKATILAEQNVYAYERVCLHGKPA